ncbi:MAG: alpha/beta hydrolase [Deltaproteobacteria bacterium]|nr:alpha/beta hydrolase [Deltaproteobacteria bacterium]
MCEPRVLETRIGKTNLQYLLYEGSGPTMVMLHATGFNPWLWHPIAREFSGRFRVIAPFFCDHRNADPYRGGLGWNILAGDFVSFCRNLRIHKPYLVGHSMGGCICVLAHGLVPHLAERMILIEPILLPESWYEKPLALEEHSLARQAIRRKNYWQSSEEAKEYFLSKPLFRNWDCEMFDLYLRYGLTVDSKGGLHLVCPPRSEAAIFVGCASEDPWTLLPKILCPVLLLEGENSKSGPSLNLPKVAGLFPKGEYRLVPGVGHLIPMEKPTFVSMLIEHFFV